MEDMKSKISVTVESHIVTWIDQQVETQRFRNRSHAVEVALMRFIEKEDTQASQRQPH
jgi:Predicted transcriptional regulators containing the CopG/Arc/MetJ DNA-binding domain